MPYNVQNKAGGQPLFGKNPSESAGAGFPKSSKRFFRCASISTGYLVRFPNCHECQLGFQCPKKWEIGKEWPVVEKITLR